MLFELSLIAWPKYFRATSMSPCVYLIWKHSRYSTSNICHWWPYRSKSKALSVLRRKLDFVARNHLTQPDMKNCYHLIIKYNFKSYTESKCTKWYVWYEAVSTPKRKQNIVVNEAINDMNYSQVSATTALHSLSACKNLPYVKMSVFAIVRPV